MTTSRVRVDDLEVHYVEHGSGTPLIALHGSGVDHRELEAAMEPVFEHRRGYRRIYIDLPGMGETIAPARLASNNDVVRVLVDLVGELLEGRPFVILGHSYGAYLARAVAATYPAHARGLGLLCPIGEQSRDVPTCREPRVDEAAYDLLAEDQVAGFDEYFLIRNPRTARRYRDCVVPGTREADATALGRIFADWALPPRPEELVRYPHPTLILAGRQDTAVGFASAEDLLDHYPHATFAVLDDAGHALPHEQPALLTAFVHEWLRRVEASARRAPRP